MKKEKDLLPDPQAEATGSSTERSDEEKRRMSEKESKEKGSNSSISKNQGQPADQHFKDYKDRNNQGDVTRKKHSQIKK